jgi:hypothetical protein
MIRSCAFTDPAAAADAAWAAADALHIAADVLGSGALRQAADSYARAARHGYGRIPRAHASGGQAAGHRPIAGSHGNSGRRGPGRGQRRPSRQLALLAPLCASRPLLSS